MAEGVFIEYKMFLGDIQIDDKQTEIIKHKGNYTIKSNNVFFALNT